jgi:hypothetical protein
MKKLIFIFILFLFSLMALSCSQEISQQDKIESLLNKFSDYLIEKSVFADCKDGYKYLLEAVLLAAAETNLPGEFMAHVTQASQIFKKTRIFNPEGVTLLHQAYVLVNDGNELKVPASIVSRKDAEDYSRKSVREAIQAFEENNPETTVKLLMELALLVVTPIEKVL